MFKLINIYRDDDIPNRFLLSFDVVHDNPLKGLVRSVCRLIPHRECIIWAENPSVTVLVTLLHVASQ